MRLVCGSAVLRFLVCYPLCNLYMQTRANIHSQRTPPPCAWQVRSLSQMQALVAPAAEAAARGQAAPALQQQVVDARSAGRFQGLEPEPRPGLRPGHMPGARNVPFTQVCQGGG
jgi:3-mercaptopyruvate sulfurtransferase SseA